jgi:hypothetical protein
VYPVGTSAAALTRMAAEHARANGARNFAIVYDKTSSWGREADESLADYVDRMGGTVKARIGVDPTSAGLGTESEQFRHACEGNACDFVFLALLPDTASTWFQLKPPGERVETAALPTLLTGKFPESCFSRNPDEARCNGLTAWSGFVPWFGHDVDDVGQAVERRTAIEKGSAMVESAMLGAGVLIDALQEAGPNVTRKSLRAALDNRRFTSYPVAPALEWGNQLPRVGNPVAQPWRLTTDTATTWSERVDGWSQGEVVGPWSNAIASWPPSVRAWADDVVTTWPDLVRSWGDNASATWPTEAEAWLDNRLGTWRGAPRRWMRDVATSWSCQVGTCDAFAWADMVDSWPTMLQVWLYGLGLGQDWATAPPQPGAPDTERGPVPETDTPLPKQQWEATGTGWTRDPG